MKKLFYVDLQMCGGEELPHDFDLEEFCEVLQGKLFNVEVIAMANPHERAVNLDPSLVPPTIFSEALGEYCQR